MTDLSNMAAMATRPRHISLRAAGEILGLSNPTLIKYIREGRYNGGKFGDGRWFVEFIQDTATGAMQVSCGNQKQARPAPAAEVAEVARLTEDLDAARTYIKDLETAFLRLNEEIKGLRVDGHRPLLKAVEDLSTSQLLMQVELTSLKAQIRELKPAAATANRVERRLNKLTSALTTS